MKKSTKNYNEIKDAGIKLNAETKYESKCAGKRFFAVMLLIVFASVMLFGCGEENTEKEKNSSQKQEQSEGSSDNKAEKGTGKNAGKKAHGKKRSDKKKKKDDGKSNKSKNKRGSKKEKTSKNKNNKGESAEKSGGSQTGNNSSENTSKQSDSKKNATNKHKTKNQSKSKSGKSKKKTSRNKEAKKYCWLKIQCKKLKGRKDLDPGTKSLVPKSGYILKKKKMEIKKGETVYSLITKARDKYRFALNVQDTAFGKYIAGVAGIEEKACGDESGWKYSVNGKYPDRSCSAVKVKAGDSIEWVYVLKANQK